ncbi:MAG TPA: hypothetical protein VL651_13895 [Bacteroidia bacterium]|jgi:hypothetical protein|nr:hypothetical protein [Bacteroidia bacterium]
MKFYSFLFASLFSTVIFAQQDTAKKDFKPSGKLYGYAFGDYYYKTHSDSLNRGNSYYSNMQENMNAFEMRRVYLGYDYAISERFSSELLLAYEGNTLSDNTRTIYVKSANVRWKNIYKGADLIFGLQQTPAFPMSSEKWWGYRSIEKTILDMRKGASSADLGIGLQAKVNDNLGYDLLIANGSGTKLEGDVFKKIYGDVWMKLLNQKLMIDLYADHEQTMVTPVLHKYKMNAKLGLAYTTDAFTVGAEVFLQNQFHYVGYADTTGGNTVTDTTNAMTLGASVFVRGNIIKDKLGFFARFDMYDPDLSYNNTYVYTMGAAPVTENFITAGIDYTPMKNIHIMPNIWWNTYMSRAKGVTGRTKSDYDLVPRLTVWYNFK